MVRTVRRLEGAYSLVIMTEQELIGVRDPFGFRPLCIGKLGDAWVLASETCALDLIHAKFVREVEPGEIVVIDEKGLRSIQAFPLQEQRAFCIFEYIYFARPDSYVFGTSVNEVRAIDRDQPIAAVRPMTEWISTSTAEPRYRTTLFGLFAALAMMLAATGIYGVMSYSVAQRTHEIGVRMALGAQRVDVLKLVVGQGMVLTCVGVILGLLGAFALTRVMSTLLFGITAKDPLTFVIVAALLLAVAFFACFVPARRATKVDPLIALRYE